VAGRVRAAREFSLRVFRQGRALLTCGGERAMPYV